MFVLNCKEKVKRFAELFSQQCKPVITFTDNVLPNFSYLTNEKIEQVPTENKNSISLIRKLNPYQTNREMDIWTMVILCDQNKFSATPIYIQKRRYTIN